MENEQKIQLIDSLLEIARDPEMRKASRVGGEDGHRFRICEKLIQDKGEAYWISIEYIDR